jgi:riboflavin biosynthesis pyrimidine reductase
MTAALRRILSTDPERGPVRHARLPAALHDRYDGDLVIPLVDGRPTVAVNFVTTLDGVVSFDPAAGQGGGAVSGYFEPDRFVMGLLRSVADAVMVGAGTMRSDKTGRWVAASVHPASAEDTARVRSDLSLAPNPTTVVVTASGRIPADHPGLSDPKIPAVVATTDAGRANLGDLAPHVEVVSTAAESVDAAWLLGVFAERGAQLVLCEGGPHLIGSLAGARLIDELFLTVSPQLAGRDEASRRLALVEDHVFGVEDAPWAHLADVRVAGNHMFTRYRFGGAGQ